MSLINKMLAELEKHRKKTNPEQKHVLSGLNNNIKKYQASIWIKVVYWIFSLLIFSAAILYLLTPTGKFNTIFHTKGVSILSKSSSSIPVPKVVPSPNQNTKILPIAQLENLVVKTENDKTILDIFLTARPYYYVERSTDMQQLAITFGNTSMHKNFPIALGHTLIQALESKQNNSSLQLNLKLAPNVKIDALEFYDTPPMHLQLILAVPAAANVKMSKVIVPLSPDNQAKDQYERALQLVAQNQTQAAITQLHFLVVEFPNHTQARELLANLLLKEGKAQSAIETIDIGLKKFSSYTPFIKLKARSLAYNGEYAHAIELLENNKPEDISDDPEFYAIMAAIYNEQGSFLAAARIYYQLTNIQPEKSAWWIGLGLALEDANKKKAALEAYQQAFQSEDLTVELREFLTAKLKRS